MEKKDKKQKPKRKEVLTDHHRLGKILVPQLLNLFEGQMLFANWVDTLLPELVWISLLFVGLTEKRAIEVAITCAKEAHNIVAPEKACGFAFVSDYDSISNQGSTELRERLEKLGALSDIQSCLYPLVSLYTECAFGCLFDEAAKERHRVDLKESIRILKLAVEQCLGRKSRPAMYVQTTAIYLLRMLDVIRYSRECPPESLEAMRDYPNTEESLKLAATVRATIGIAHEMLKGKGWSAYFWEHGYTISVCEFPSDDESTYIESYNEWIKEALLAGSKYKGELRAQLSSLWNGIKSGPPKCRRAEVLSGLLARQARLAAAIATDPNLWCLDLGGIMLRCMADTHITLTWLARKGTPEDFEKYVLHGLGQEKLYYEHAKAHQDEINELDSDHKEDIDALKEWIDAQRRTELLPVELGNWSGKHTRELALEVDCHELYNLVYTPMSCAVHGMWNSLARWNLHVCGNPLHGIHRVPQLEPLSITLDVPPAAANLMESSSTEWEKAMEIDSIVDSASEAYIETWGRLLEKLQDPSGETEDQVTSAK
jgi:hypothetical protein